jgi:hypothetical protein
MVVQAYNPSNGEAEARRSPIPVQLHSETSPSTISKQNITKRKKFVKHFR